MLGGLVMVAILSVKTKVDEQPEAPNLLLVLTNFQLPIRGFALGLLQPATVGKDKRKSAAADASVGRLRERLDARERWDIAVRPFECGGEWVSAFKVTESEGENPMFSDWRSGRQC